MKKENRNNSILYKIAWLEMIASVMPLFVIAFFARQASDDFSYTYFTRHAMIEGGNLIDLLKQAFYSVYYFLQHWNGLYFSSFLQSLSSNVFGAKFYYINTFVLIIALFLAMHLFFWVLLCKVAKQKDVRWAFLATLITFYFLQTLPCPVQGLYWHNGAVNYIFIWAIFMCWASCVLIYLTNEKVAPLSYWIGFILTAFVAGGNHIAQGLVMGFSILAFIYGVIQKKRRGTLLYFIFAVIAFIFNTLSAGTKTRWDTVGYDHSVKSSLVHSLADTVQYSLQWFSFSMVLLLIVALILLRPVIHWYTDHYKVTGKKALMISGLSVIIILCMNFIPTYALGYSGSGRVTNFNYMMYILLMIFNAFYYICLSRSILKKNELIDNLEKVDDFLSKNQKLWFSVLFFALTYISIIGIGTCIRVPYGSTAANALKDLATGEAQAYAREFDQREVIFAEHQGEDVEVESFTSYPYTIFYKDIEVNSDDFKNGWVAHFYGLKSVTRTPDMNGN